MCFVVALLVSVFHQADGACSAVGAALSKSFGPAFV